MGYSTFKALTKRLGLEGYLYIYKELRIYTEWKNANLWMTTDLLDENGRAWWNSKNEKLRKGFCILHIISLCFLAKNMQRMTYDMGKQLISCIRLLFEPEAAWLNFEFENEKGKTWESWRSSYCHELVRYYDRKKEMKTTLLKTIYHELNGYYLSIKERK